MKRPCIHLHRLIALAHVGIVCCLFYSAWAEAAGSVLANADLHYRQKSYAAALKGYRAAQKARQVPEKRTNEILYRITEALGKTRQWDAALAK